MIYFGIKNAKFLRKLGLLTVDWIFEGEGGGREAICG
jgi:hypothetical protein